MNFKMPLFINRSFNNTFTFLVLSCSWVIVLCTDIDKCYLSKTNNEGEKLLNRILPLFGQTFRTNKNGYNYAVGICTDPPKSHENVSVTRSKIKEETLVLGRRNETSIVGGDTWVLLKYECGDKKPNGSDPQCLGQHSASIYILCDPAMHDDPQIKLVEEDGCHHKFVLPVQFICKHEEEVSGGTIFLVLLSVLLFMYFIVGIIYRRLVHNAQGCQQLPHFTFWQRIGAMLSDGCNYLCRCDIETEDSWNNITRNFDSGDRDDALLRP